MSQELADSLKSIFDKHSILFLGVNQEKYQRFFNSIVYSSKVHVDICMISDPRARQGLAINR